jgi:hypothetical protein
VSKIGDLTQRVWNLEQHQMWETDHHIDILRAQVNGYPSKWLDPAHQPMGLVQRVKALEEKPQKTINWHFDEAMPAQKPAPITLTIPEIARRWGVTSLDAVKAVMDANNESLMHQLFYGTLDVYTIPEVEAVERRLLMPDAVARFIDSAEV